MHTVYFMISLSSFTRKNIRFDLILYIVTRELLTPLSLFFSDSLMAWRFDWLHGGRYTLSVHGVNSAAAVRKVTIETLPCKMIWYKTRFRISSLRKIHALVKYYNCRSRATSEYTLWRVKLIRSCCRDKERAPMLINNHSQLNAYFRGTFS